MTLITDAVIDQNITVCCSLFYTLGELMYAAKMAQYAGLSSHFFICILDQ